MKMTKEEVLQAAEAIRKERLLKQVRVWPNSTGELNVSGPGGTVRLVLNDGELLDVVGALSARHAAILTAFGVANP